MEKIIITPTKDLCAKLLHARTAMNLKQPEVDYRCGWRAPHYGYFERGRKGIRKDRLVKIMSVLGIDNEREDLNYDDKE